MIETSSQKYARDFGILSASAVGVILTHAREPHRVCEALREWAFTTPILRKVEGGAQKEVPRLYREWDCLRGWSAEQKQTDKAETPVKWDGIGGLLLALKKVQDIPGNGQAAFRDTVCAMVYPHFELGKTAQAVQCLKLYAQELTEGATRLVLIVPEGVQLPKELENDVVTLDFELPSAGELGSIYERELTNIVARRGLPKTTKPFSEKQVSEILAVGAGMTEQEFSTSIARACTTYRESFPKVTLPQFTGVLQKAKTELVKRSEVLELVAPMDIDTLGGLELFKEWLHETAVCFQPAAREFGCDLPQGVAFFGPPGTGKSVLCQCISSVFGLPLIRFDVSKIFNKMIGGSEERVAGAISLLKAMSPCIAWVDEVDKAGMDPRQASGDSGVGKRAMGSLLTFMAEPNTGVFWTVSANRVEGVPPEFLRPGRLDEIFSILPPNEAERRAIFSIHLRKRGKNPDEIEGMEDAVAASEGYVGAELEQCVKDAIKKAFARNLPLTGALLSDQVKTRKPISVAFADDFNAMKSWAANNARPASPVTAGALTRTRTRVASGRNVE